MPAGIGNPPPPGLETGPPRCLETAGCLPVGSCGLETGPSRCWGAAGCAHIANGKWGKVPGPGVGGELGEWGWGIMGTWPGWQMAVGVLARVGKGEGVGPGRGESLYRSIIITISQMHTYYPKLRAHRPKPPALFAMSMDPSKRLSW